MKYQITLTESQMGVLRRALEEYFRVSMNQWQGLAERLTSITFPSGKPGVIRSPDFDERSMVKDCARTALEYAGHAVFESKPVSYYMPEDVNSAIDMWRILNMTSCDNIQYQATGSLQLRSKDPLIEVIPVG